MQGDTRENSRWFITEASRSGSPGLADDTQGAAHGRPVAAGFVTQRFIPAPSKWERRRVVAFFNLLNSEPFKKFVLPVSLEQIEAALEFLDRHFDQWEDDDYSLAAWEYVLPAIHKLYPDRKCSGYTVTFSPRQAAHSSFVFLLCLGTSIVLAGGFGAVALYVLLRR